MENNKGNNLTIAGTDIDQVKRLNSQSGLSYNEVKLKIAKEYVNKTGSKTI
ncbi:hypothetical protein ACUXCC_004245 [Cytobacillus horneckiae]|uniref:hypothetical protein n=1 Tax=Cytobacillus horneckiae TaxID=549687 RepID=UPI000ABD7CDD|nr:hypothetical protein [Cytobacillus horneckiae]MBN6886866.1 hypothetical protein [Cytobacillus horneckiae]MCM3177665.1 hypothetical protein [Cytobacillus horneckiae]MEC1157973.1 hypothetical protein [Cytobacillus horneckiae]MED2937102.1 hypothetical protein [Cytobacillus horneckiae]